MGKKKKKKAAKKVAEPGKPTKDDNVLPKAKAKPPQIDTLVTLVRQLDRKLAKVQRQQTEDREERRGWEQREQERQESAPSPPAPWEAAFASLPEFMAEMCERVGGIESRLQQPPRDPNLDVPASVLALRRMFAGACKTLNLIRPTPAIVGRAMHAEKATSRTAAKSPYLIFNAIYEAVKRAVGFHTSPPQQFATSAMDFIHLDVDMVALMEGRSHRPKQKHTTYYDAQLSPRLELLENIGSARVEKNQSGKRTNYSRYLTPLGCGLFDGWPEWTDTTGGTGLVDEVISPTVPQSPSEPPPTEPTTAEPAPAFDPTQPPT